LGSCPRCSRFSKRRRYGQGHSGECWYVSMLYLTTLVCHRRIW
jgi:hypothetical protein